MSNHRRVVLTVLAAPLWFLGAVVGTAVALACWVGRAVALGYSDGRHAR